MNPLEKVCAVLCAVVVLGMIACFLCAGLVAQTPDQRGNPVLGGVFLIGPALLFVSML